MVKPPVGKPAARRADNPSRTRSKAKQRLLFSSTKSLSDQPSCSNFNRYSALSDMDDFSDFSESNINLNSSKVFAKPPPIVADVNVSMKEIQLLTGDGCTYKRTSIGTKIFPQTQEKYDFCIKVLKEGLIEFHTFNSKSNKLYTTFLYGLPRLNVDEIIKDLIAYNLPPASVTEVQTRFSSADNAVYKVQFNRKSFNPNNLKNIKLICKIHATWKKYKPKQSERPTICWNCQMHGHGGDHCNRKSNCMTCAKAHRTDECPLTKDNKRPHVFSCFNCIKAGQPRSDHAANDVNCPMRQKYIEIRQKVTANQRNRHTVVRPRQARTSANINNTHHVSPLLANNNNNSTTYASAVRNECPNLFNIDELFNIFSSSLDDLCRCTSKVQQIQIVMSLLRYAYDLK